jgi:hypothetical protein
MLQYLKPRIQKSSENGIEAYSFFKEKPQLDFFLSQTDN